MISNEKDTADLPRGTLQKQHVPSDPICSTQIDLLRVNNGNFPICIPFYSMHKIHTNYLKTDLLLHISFEKQMGRMDNVSCIDRTDSCCATGRNVDVFRESRVCDSVTV